MTFIIWLVLAIPVGFVVGAIGMALWLMLKPVALVGIRAAWMWVKAALGGLG